MAYVREIRCGGIGLSRVVVRNRIAREEISNSQNSTPEAQSKISHAIALMKSSSPVYFHHKSPHGGAL